MKMLVCCTIIILAFATMGEAAAPLKGLWHMDIRANNAFSWAHYETPSLYAARYGVTNWYFQIGNANLNDVIMFYEEDHRFSRSQFHVRVIIDNTGINWQWKHHPHVHFADVEYGEHNRSLAPRDYWDMIALFGDLGHRQSILSFPDDEITIHDSPVILSALDKLQWMIDNQRRNAGLEIFPDGEATTWTARTALAGGQWVRYDRATGDIQYYISKIDIPASTNTRPPNQSAAFRLPHQRRVAIEYDANDLSLELTIENDGAVSTLGENEIRIDSVNNVVSLKLPTALSDKARATRRFSMLSIDPPITAHPVSKWYVARINHRGYDAATNIIEYRIDPQETKSTYADGTVVTVQIEQTNPPPPPAPPPPAPPPPAPAPPAEETPSETPPSSPPSGD